MSWRSVLVRCAALLCTASAVCSEACAQQSAQVPVLRSTTRIVYVDVVVRDGNDKIVRGLHEKDFQIQEDKHPQQTSLFEEHSFHEGDAAVKVKPAADEELSNVPAGASRTSLNIVLLDLLDTSLLDQAYARKRMIAFLQHLPPGRQVGVMVLSNGLHLIQNFTTDSALLTKAAQSIDLKAPIQFRGRARQQLDEQLSTYMDSQLGPQAGLGTGELLRRSVLQEDIAGTLDRLAAANEAFRQIARAVNGYSGRKNLFWLAEQFPSSSYYDLQNLSSMPRGRDGAGLDSGSAGGRRSPADANSGLPSQRDWG